MCICCSDRIEVPSGRGVVVAEVVVKVVVGGMLKTVLKVSSGSTQHKIIEVLGAPYFRGALQHSPEKKEKKVKKILIFYCMAQPHQWSSTIAKCTRLTKKPETRRTPS